MTPVDPVTCRMEGEEDLYRKLEEDSYRKLVFGLTKKRNTDIKYEEILCEGWELYGD